MGAAGILVIPDDLACGVDAVSSRMITNSKRFSDGSVSVNWHDTASLIVYLAEGSIGKVEPVSNSRSA